MVQESARNNTDRASYERHGSIHDLSSAHHRRSGLAGIHGDAGQNSKRICGDRRLRREWRAASDRLRLITRLMGRKGRRLQLPRRRCLDLFRSSFPGDFEFAHDHGMVVVAENLACHELAHQLLADSAVAPACIVESIGEATRLREESLLVRARSVVQMQMRRVHESSSQRARTPVPVQILAAEEQLVRAHPLVAWFELVRRLLGLIAVVAIEAGETVLERELPVVAVNRIGATALQRRAVRKRRIVVLGELPLSDERQRCVSLAWCVSDGDRCVRSDAAGRRDARERGRRRRPAIPSFAAAR